MSTPDWTHHAARALTEDRATDDITTALLGAGREQPAVGRIRAECDFVVAGMPLVDAVFRELQPSVAVERLVADGSSVKAGEVLAVVRGSAATLLAGERVALNYLQRLCGVATVTRRAVNAIAGTASVITDTRKTTPGLRELEKYAVRIGGGENHRASLADAVLWKDNHWELLRSLGGDLRTALRDVPDGVAVCVEVESGEQLAIALAVGVKWILADNQPPDVIHDWATRCGPDVTLEASGGITPETAVNYAKAGAHRISMGVLTYAPDPASVSFEIGRSESTGDHPG